MKAALQTMAVALVVLAAYAVVDSNDRSANARAEFLRHADESCLPLRKDETAIIVSDGRQMRCQVFANSGFGMAPRLVSAAVMDMPL